MKYERTELLNHIVDLKSEIERIPTKSDMDNAENRPASSTYSSRFSSWSESLCQAGFEPYHSRESYSLEELVNYLKKFNEEFDEVPTFEKITELDEYPSGTIYNQRFDSWNKALRQAGFEVNEPEFLNYNREKLIANIVELASEIGRTPKRSDMDEAEGRPASSTYNNYFDSWNDVLREADMSPNRYYETGDELLCHLREVADELGRSPTVDDIDSMDDRPSSVHFYNKFESWNNALEEAGLEVNKDSSGNYTREELLEHINDLAEDLGQVPTGAEMSRAEGRPSVATYRNHFGKWANAVEKAGLNIINNASYTKEELLEHINDLAEDLGQVPTKTEMDRAEGRPSVATYKNHFGKWTNAVKRADI